MFDGRANVCVLVLIWESGSRFSYIYAFYVSPVVLTQPPVHATPPSHRGDLRLRKLTISQDEKDYFKRGQVAKKKRRAAAGHGSSGSKGAKKQKKGKGKGKGKGKSK